MRTTCRSSRDGLRWRLVDASFAPGAPLRRGQSSALIACIITLSYGVVWIVILSLSTMSRSGSDLLQHGHDEPAQLGRSLSRTRRVGLCASCLSPCKHSIAVAGGKVK
jgi:hypothetical protein